MEIKNCLNQNHNCSENKFISSKIKTSFNTENTHTQHGYLNIERETKTKTYKHNHVLQWHIRGKTKKQVFEVVFHAKEVTILNVFLVCMLLGALQFDPFVWIYIYICDAIYFVYTYGKDITIGGILHT